MYQCMLYTSDFPELLSIMYAVTCMPMILRCLLETQASFRPKNAHRRTYHRSRLPARLALKTLPQKTISSVFYIGNSCTGYQLKVESSSGECLHSHLKVTSSSSKTNAFLRLSWLSALWIWVGAGHLTCSGARQSLVLLILLHTVNRSGSKMLIRPNWILNWVKSCAHTISGSLRSAPTDALPLLSGILPHCLKKHGMPKRISQIWRSQPPAPWSLALITRSWQTSLETSS